MAAGEHPIFLWGSLGGWFFSYDTYTSSSVSARVRLKPYIIFNCSRISSSCLHPTSHGPTLCISIYNWYSWRSSQSIFTFVQNTKAAPKLAQTVLAEVHGLSAVLGHLQTYLIGVASPSKSGASLILVEQVIVTLAECVTTFSELEDLLGISDNNDMAALDRMKWAMKESKVSDIQRRLQSNKSSLTLMLTILQWFASPFS